MGEPRTARSPSWPCSSRRFRHQLPLSRGVLPRPSRQRTERPPDSGRRPGVVLQGRPRLADDRSAVILRDEVREPADRRQPELILGGESTRRIPFVRIRAHGLLPPPTIFIRCGETTQPLRLTASSQDSGRTTGTYTGKHADGPLVDDRAERRDSEGDHADRQRTTERDGDERRQNHRPASPVQTRATANSQPMAGLMP